MKIASVCGLNQLVSHCFGLYLFAALFPMMQQSIELSHWHLAIVGISSQLSYLAGAILVGMIGHRIGARRLIVVMGFILASSLFSLSILKQPLSIILVMNVMAASAAISWTAIVGVISEVSAPEKRSTHISTAASGTAWGYSLSGLLVLWVLPIIGWQNTWVLASALSGAIVLVTFIVMRQANTAQSNPINIDEITPPPAYTALSLKELIKLVLVHPVAFFSCLICFLVCFITIPFINWLSAYLTELQLPMSLSGSIWTTIGVIGMASGFAVGRLADKAGVMLALVLICSLFALSQVLFSLDPAQFALIAGIGYGLMYFPVWGVVAGWLSHYFSSGTTMQISSICLVTSGIGGASGNFIAGVIQEFTGSLQGVYLLFSLTAGLLALISLYLFIRRHQLNDASSEHCQIA